MSVKMKREQKGVNESLCSSPSYLPLWGTLVRSGRFKRRDEARKREREMAGRRWGDREKVRCLFFCISVHSGLKFVSLLKEFEENKEVNKIKYLGKFRFRGRAGRQVRSCCPGFLGGEAGMRSIQMKGKEECGGRLPRFSSQLHFPTGRRDFCPYLA